MKSRRLVLITGGGGFLGRHLIEQLTHPRWEIVAPSSAAMDIRRSSTVDAIHDWCPAVVVHLAYRKADRHTTVDGTRHVARGAAAAGARLVHLSTDLVFGGRSAPYTESDRTDPLTQYGRDKAEAERVVPEECPGAVIIRTSLLYGTHHEAPIQNDVRWALTEPDRSPMTFFTDEVRCPVHAADVASAIVDLASRTEVVGPLHVAGPEPVSRADFARRTAQWMGLDEHRLAAATIAESGLDRPAHVVLDTGAAEALGLRCRTLDEALSPTR